MQALANVVQAVTAHTTQAGQLKGECNISGTESIDGANPPGRDARVLRSNS
jgi:hypothetical protein